MISAAGPGFSADYTETGQPVLTIGYLLGQRYEILSLLGEGGMGAVYKARDVELGRMIALKVIRRELAGNRGILDRFKQELILATQVTHRNVVRIYDLGEAEGLKFITMEFVEGEDLRTLIHQRSKVPPREAAEIIDQVCRALEAAHGAGVIHRDLKPQNIMRDKAGRILVMDFGLAKTLEGDGMTQTGALVGTMEYMSPEQALAQSLDQRSDIFSVGLIFYELLTGATPFRADSALASLIKRTQERVAPIAEADSTIPVELEPDRQPLPGARPDPPIPVRLRNHCGSGTLAGHRSQRRIARPPAGGARPMAGQKTDGGSPAPPPCSCCCSCSRCDSSSGPKKLAAPRRWSPGCRPARHDRWPSCPSAMAPPIPRTTGLVPPWRTCWAPTSASPSICMRCRQTGCTRCSLIFA